MGFAIIVYGLSQPNGRLPKWPTGADCKSAGLRLRWFEIHHLPPLLHEPRVRARFWPVSYSGFGVRIASFAHSALFVRFAVFSLAFPKRCWEFIIKRPIENLALRQLSDSHHLCDAPQEKAGAAGAVLHRKEEWMIHSDLEGFRFLHGRTESH